MVASWCGSRAYCIVCPERWPQHDSAREVKKGDGDGEGDAEAKGEMSTRRRRRGGRLVIV